MLNRQLTPSELWTGLILFFSLFLGIIVRFSPAVLSDFPINDGGLFYSMTRELQHNNYHLPEFTTYNNNKIPFAYPPLGFYIGGFFVSVFHVSILDMLLWLPAVLCTLSIVAVFLLARSMLDSAPKGALASLAFALMPRSISWFLMGGGLTRSLGQLFLILTVYSVYMVLARDSYRHILLSMLFGGLACLSHPEIIVHTAATCLLLLVFYVRTPKGISNFIKIGLGVLLLSSPWWVTVLLRHGFDPFLAAMQTGGHDPLFWVDILLPVFAEEKFVTILTVLGLIGFAIQILRKRFFLVIWLLIPFVVEPRSSSSIAILPLSLLASVSLSEIVLPGLLAIEKKVNLVVANSDDWINEGAKSRGVQIALGYVIIMAFINSYTYSINLSSYHLSVDDRVAMSWIQNNTPQNARFLVITGLKEPLGDLVQEWFPVMSSRQSLSTLQGLEWVSGNAFAKGVRELPKLQSCVNREVICLSVWSAENHVTYDYILIKRTAIVPSFRLETMPEIPAVLLNSLQVASEYKLVYESGGDLIFAYKKPDF